jgi:putative transposase
MDVKGRALDNILLERRWRSVKYARFIPTPMPTRETLGRDARYPPFYNDERPHQALNYQTLAEVYFQPSASHGGVLADPVG